MSPYLPSRRSAVAPALLAGAFLMLGGMSRPLRAQEARGAGPDSPTTSSSTEAEATATKAKPSSSRMAVHGAGWIEDRALVLLLDSLREDSRVLDANAVEDAAVVLVSALRDEGWLRPEVTAIVTTGAGGEHRYTWDYTLDTLVDRPLDVAVVRWEVKRGVRYTLESVDVQGVTALPKADVQAFFRGENYLLGGAETRLYTPARLSRGADALRETLRNAGYADAAVSVQEVRSDHKTGLTRVRLVVDQGPKWVVHEVRVQTVNSALRTELETLLRPMSGMEHGAAKPTEVVWARAWEQAASQAVRNVLHKRGYPDTFVNFRVEPADVPDDAAVRPTEVEVWVDPGDRYRIGDVRFGGRNDVHENVLRRRIDLRRGDWLDPDALETARQRLGRLGVFRRVSVLTPDGAEDGVRDVVFDLEPGRRREVSLLLGYGSYEQVRGGVEWRRSNLFGHAQELRGKVVQSFKATTGEFIYGVPEIFGEEMSASAKLTGLRREEVSFTRHEVGATVGVRREIESLHGEVSADYTWESLRVSGADVSSLPGENNTISAALNLGYTHTQLDNPLVPRLGQRYYGRAELASRVLGGEVDFQRLEFGAAWHRGAGPGRWWHFGITHGVLLGVGTDSVNDVPVNKRFFPGGESSIRGFREGEASPRGPDGTFVGAETYTLVNLELEQELRRNWSAVAFVDMLGDAEKLENYPANEYLVSAGLGLRFQTLVGPVRLEYGYNIKKRDTDGSGALHFSVGFPF